MCSVYTEAISKISLQLSVVIETVTTRSCKQSVRNVKGKFSSVGQAGKETVPSKLYRRERRAGRDLTVH